MARFLHAAAALREAPSRSALDDLRAAEADVRRAALAQLGSRADAQLAAVNELLGAAASSEAVAETLRAGTLTGTEEAGELTLGQGAVDSRQEDEVRKARERKQRQREEAEAAAAKAEQEADRLEQVAADMAEHTAKARRHADEARVEAERLRAAVPDVTPTDAEGRQGRQDKLGTYKQMRDFERTPEPSGGAPSDEGNRFVVQEHHATALHWDFRLERDGVLVSWAVPKGIPPHPAQNHLAVHTEDHPLDYIDFEGDIPAGEYGGGKVILWDQGTYECEKFNDREVIVVLHGRRARGRYDADQDAGQELAHAPHGPARGPDPRAHAPRARADAPNHRGRPASRPRLALRARMGRRAGAARQRRRPRRAHRPGRRRHHRTLP